MVLSRHPNYNTHYIDMAKEFYAPNLRLSFHQKEQKRVFIILFDICITALLKPWLSNYYAGIVGNILC